PPSVLLSQLRDLLNSGWQIEGGRNCADSLTHEYPMQPFSVQYFNGTHQTYAHEWQAAHQQTATEPTANQRSALVTSAQPEALPLLTLRLLDDFLANPCRHYLSQRFKT